MIGPLLSKANYIYNENKIMNNKYIYVTIWLPQVTEDTMNKVW